MDLNPVEAVMLLFATIGPLKVTVVCATLTADTSDEFLKRVAARSVLTAAAVCLVFAVFGELILLLFKVSVPALQVAGGIIVVLFSIEMVGGKKVSDPTAGVGPTRGPSEDIAVYPLAVPLMASVSGLVAIVSLLSQKNDFATVVFLAVVISAIMAMNYVCLRGSRYLVRFAGPAAINVSEKIMGILLAALGVELFVMGLVGYGFVTRPGP